MTTAQKIAVALGDACRSGPRWRCRCPVHDSSGPTLALLDGDRGLAVKCFAGCDSRDILAELCRRGLLGGTGNRYRTPWATLRPPERDDTARRIAVARRIWDAAHDARRSPVAAYLAGRGITVNTPPSLRWAPALRRRDGTDGPAMIGRIDSIDGELVGIARTWLTRDGAGSWHRHDRAMLGRAAGGAVRLASAAETLLIGEGIETCLAAMQATAMPAWAALSTSGLISLLLPAIAQDIIILADHDANGAGERAARAAADRWLVEGRRVRIAIPPKPGTDFADVLAGRAYPRVTEAHNVAA
jgi:putative DNA primase/helicase